MPLTSIIQIINMKQLSNVQKQVHTKVSWYRSCNQVFFPGELFALQVTTVILCNTRTRNIPKHLMQHPQHPIPRLGDFKDITT